MNRMFVAALPSAEAVDDLDAFLEPRRAAGAFRWVPPEQWHLTLAFLEHVPDRVLDDLVARFERAARKRHPMTARLEGGGAFPHVGGARVIWAGVTTETPGTAPDGAEELRRLATGCHAAAARAGVAMGSQRFRAHLTLARMRGPVEATRWVKLLDAYAGPRWALDRVALVASHLGEGPRGRPRHEVVETFALGAATTH